MAPGAHEQEGVEAGGPEGHLHRGLADAAAPVGLQAGHRLAADGIPVDLDRFPGTKAADRHRDEVAGLAHLAA